MLGKFFAFFFVLIFFQKSGIVIRVSDSNSLDQDQLQLDCFIWPDLGPNCLQRFTYKPCFAKSKGLRVLFSVYVQFLFADNYYDVLVNAINVFPW